MRILPSNPIERRAAWAILTHAILRWETQACIFAMIAALLILPGYGKMVALLGLLGALWVIRSSLTDARLNAEVAFQALEEEVRLSNLATPAYQALLKESLAYHRKIQELLLGLREGPLKQQVELRALDMAGWIRGMYNLARKVEDIQQRGAFAEDLKTLPGEIQALEWRLSRAGPDSDVLRDTLEKKRQSLAALTEVQQALARADNELRDAAAAIENIYSQLLRMATVSQLPADAVSRLSRQIEDGVASVRLMADALSSALQGLPLR